MPNSVYHNAIYVDRMFNATEFMQSMDRIHRYGLDSEGKVICRENEVFIEFCNAKIA